MKKILAITALPLLLAACSKNAEEAAIITPEDLQHHNWTLVKIDTEVLTTPNRLQPPNLEIGEKMMASGNAGCNNFFGQSELKNNKFRIEKVGMTMKMCIGDAMKTEIAVTQSLSAWNDITLTKETLILKSDVHKLTFKLNDRK